MQRWKRSGRRWRTRAIHSRRSASVLAGAAAAGTLLAAVLLLAGCGGSGEADGTPSPSPTSARTSTPAPTTAAPGSPTPVASPTPTGLTFEYEVQAGDTLFDIAQRFGTTVDAIVAANGLADPADIAIGQILIIPGASSTPAPTPSPTPPPANPAGTGFRFPIEGACLPASENLWPNAPRAYRLGIHEGMDFYDYDNCATIVDGTPAVAVKAGTVIRADHDYVGLTLAELNELLTRSEQQGFTDAQALDRFRGRQVWIDQGGGIVTRYAHLSGIPDNIQKGTKVSAGDVVAYVGDSGTPESVTAPGVEIHLHFEIRVGDSFLGAGLPADQVRYLYNEVFSSP
jgi:murein DD-endopeptidase MepM/ murein hydrolase activator NlpD